MLNAIMIDERDNSAVVIEYIHKRQEVQYAHKDGTVQMLISLEDIPIFHKIAISDISAGAPVIKYGEHIGIASTGIKAGMHVHEHNVQSVRENLSGSIME
jgi:altronate dehydratase small subunit